MPEQTNAELKHSTLVLERICAAPVGRVFAAFANPVERANWGTPSETAALVYDRVDFREGGVDVFVVATKAIPNIAELRPTTTSSRTSALFRARSSRRREFLAQGTLYPDVIESVSFTGGPSVTIKSHHMSAACRRART